MALLNILKLFIILFVTMFVSGTSQCLTFRQLICLLMALQNYYLLQSTTRANAVSEFAVLLLPLLAKLLMGHLNHRMKMFTQALLLFLIH